MFPDAGWYADYIASFRAVVVVLEPVDLREVPIRLSEPPASSFVATTVRPRWPATTIGCLRCEQVSRRQAPALRGDRWVPSLLPLRPAGAPAAFATTAAVMPAGDVGRVRACANDSSNGE
ncbi:MAG TPA: hypothetical protein VMR14_15940 [Streptosporangiaceae bacterium]|nr:hypothetical protein [Streptosporangiaceae bacterium]